MLQMKEENNEGTYSGYTVDIPLLICKVCVMLKQLDKVNSFKNFLHLSCKNIHN